MREEVKILDVARKDVKKKKEEKPKVLEIPEWIREGSVKAFKPREVKKNARKPKKEFAPFPSSILDIAYIWNEYEAVVKDHPSTLKWIEDPRTFIAQYINKHYSKKLEIKFERFGPDNDQLHRAVIVIDPEQDVAGVGDAPVKKDAERVASLHGCCLLVSKGLIDRKPSKRVPPPPPPAAAAAAAPTVESAKKVVNVSAKQQVIDYCADHGCLIEFKCTQIKRHKYQVELEFPARKLKVQFVGSSKKVAEIGAAEQFQKLINEQSTEPVMWTLDKPRWSLEIARNFLIFHDKQKNAVAPRVEVTTVGKDWKTEIWLDIDSKPSAVAIRPSRKESTDAAWLMAALHIRQTNASIWEKYDKKRRGTKNRTTPAPVPVVSLNIEMKQEDEIAQFINELEDRYGAVITDEPFEDEVFILEEEEDEVDDTLYSTEGEDQVYQVTSYVYPAEPEPVDPEYVEAEKVESEKPKEEVPVVTLPSFALGKEQSPEEEEECERLSAMLYEQQQNSPPTAAIMDFRSKLPITIYKDEILECIDRNNVVVIVGQTGCGKTTQLPQMLLDREISLHRGGTCNILITQPRRIAAISVAERVAFERGEKVGQSCGYTVRFDSKPPSRRGSIHYVTTGVFLRLLHEGTSLSHISHIVVDEVHERDMNTDFLLVILKRLNPLVKIVLMSATLDSGLFAEYFGQGEQSAPIVEIPGRTFPVEKHYLEEIAELLKQQYPTYRLGFSQEYLERELSLKPVKEDVIELEDNDAEIEDDLRSVGSEVIHEMLEKEHEDNDIRATGGQAAAWIHRTAAEEKEDSEIPFELLGFLISHVVLSSEEGAILVFLPGWDEIEKLHRFLLDQHPLGVDYKNGFQMHLLHSTIPPSKQQQVFSPCPAGERKLILATNIAETSVTIDDVVYVIDSGKIKEKRYDLRTRITHLTTCWISESNSRQRAGRAGRVRCGQYWGVVSRSRRERLQPYATPEIVRSDLQEICLHIKALDFPGSVAELLAETIQPPDPTVVQAALNNLRALRALDAQEKLTPLGKLLASLPVEPTLGRMVLLGIMFRCLDPVLTMAAGMAARNPFVAPAWKKEEADQSKFKWSQGTRSDHLALVNAYESWYEIYYTGRSQELLRFCDDESIARTSFSNVERTKAQLLQVLQRAGLVPREDGRKKGLFLGPPELNQFSQHLGLLRALIVAGVYPNIAVKRDKKTLATLHERHTLIHPSSVNSRKRVVEDQGGTLFCYSEVYRTVQGAPCLRETTKVQPLQAIIFGGDVTLELVRSMEIHMDGWLRFQGTPRAVRLCANLKAQLDKSLEQAFDRLGRKARHGRRQRFDEDGVLPAAVISRVAQLFVD